MDSLNYTFSDFREHCDRAAGITKKYTRRFLRQTVPSVTDVFGVQVVKTIWAGNYLVITKSPMHIQKFWRTNKTITFFSLLSCQIFMGSSFCINDDDD